MEPGTSAPCSRPHSRSWFGLAPNEAVALLLASLAVLLASHLEWWSIGMAEAWGFVTGGVCVWLVVREHMWNWPLGLANNVFFFVLFLDGRLFADMSLQVVYFGLGIYGWMNWLFGGENRGALRISWATPQPGHGREASDQHDGPIRDVRHLECERCADHWATLSNRA